jgi:2-C-methyl-D-erythritol 2,4-cyclodiphosphate synthase
MRVGIGYDIHRLEPGDGIVLAGVRVPCPYRMVAHSDGDAVLHAICDALLGAAAAGDLGEHFPETAPEHQGRDSSEFVREVLALEALQSWKIANVDVNIIAQVPRLGAHKGAMRIRLAEILGIALDRVGLKARSNEECDAVGEKRAIQTQAVVLLEPRKRPPTTTALSRHRRVGREQQAGTGRLVPKPPKKHSGTGRRTRARR